MDSFSKRLVGYAMEDNMKTDLVIQALRCAVTRRKPNKGLIHHGDKGSQCQRSAEALPSTSYQYSANSKAMLCKPVSQVWGACLDNAIINTPEAQERS